jgi:predicted MFS family arabinose efflux permease
VTVTGGLALLVYAISKAPDVGWGTARTILLLVGAAAALATFVAIELRSRWPLMPFSIFRIRSLTAANVVGFLLGAVIFANFFVLTLYVQQILHWSALKTGLTFLATAGTTVIWAGVSQALVTKVGPRRVMASGLVIMALALYWYTRIPVDGRYWPDLLPAYLVFALGMAFTFIPVSIAALAGVAPDQSGLASGLMNTSQQIGGAVGVAVAATIFTSHAKSLLGNGHSPAAAFTAGYQHAFWALLGMSLVAALAAAVLLRGERLPTTAEAGVPASY